MKKFIFGAAFAAICFFWLHYAIYYSGFYIDLHPKTPVTVTVKTEGKQIMQKNSQGRFEPFVVRGVTLSSSIAGHSASDYAVKEETWIRWFGQIQKMGANTVRIDTIYDDTFYNAFYQFNKKTQKPLYLLQGIQVSDYANHSGGDAYEKEFYGELKKSSIDAVDVLHGRKNISVNRLKGSGKYRKDVSHWVLGYIVGNEWDAGTLAYTDNSGKHSVSYKGTYFQTTKGATATETMLAKIMDHMVTYESQKYKTQKLISFQNDPKNDPFVYEGQYAKQLGKFYRMDSEHLKATGELKSGFFAAYRMYDFCPDFVRYLSAEQKKELKYHLKDLDTGLYGNGYPQLLARYHSMPVVVTGYGFSSSRGTDSAEGALTEKEQGQKIISAYDDFVRSGMSGAVITSWQDTWGRRTWNTSYALDVSNTALWKDIQTDGQGYGLLSFDPGKTESVCYVDGNKQEWDREDEVFSKNGISLSVKYDEQGIYLLVCKKGLSEKDSIYIPMDVTPKSGSKVCISPALLFEREADFLLCLKGKTDSRLLVQERYDSLRENYLMQTEGKDPFEEFPETDSAKFVPIRMILKNKKLVSEDAGEKELREAKRFDTIETGRLTYGNNNPSDKEYDSLADFCYGTDCAEVRIPWQMLNFSNPSSMEIHDDYYKNYGVEWFKIEKIYIGAGTDKMDAPVSMADVKLRGWRDQVTSHERLKQSYDMIRDRWREKDVP